jgi:hypothetical protein
MKEGLWGFVLFSIHIAVLACTHDSRTAERGFESVFHYIAALACINAHQFRGGKLCVHGIVSQSVSGNGDGDA